MRAYFAVVLYQNVHIDLSTMCPKRIHTHTFQYQWKQAGPNCIDWSRTELLYINDYSTP